MTIRLLSADDISAVHGLAQACFGISAWRREVFERAVTSHATGSNLVIPRNWVLVADLGGQRMSGYLAAESVLDEAEIQALAVAPDCRRQGVGSALLRAGLKHARRQGAARIFLEVRAGNLAAQQLYARHGFVEFARRPDYYHHPDEHAVLMRRDPRPVALD